MSHRKGATVMSDSRSSATPERVLAAGPAQSLSAMDNAPRRLAYADPPYLGCCRLYDHHHPEGPMPWDGRCWDDPETHRLLLDYLTANYDGWAYSATSTSLRTLLPLAQERVRVAAWVKPFAAFKRNVRVAYTWEPVLFVPGRDRSADGAPVGRDHIAESITLKKGFTGTKPERVCQWLLDLLGYVEGDTVDDLFPGAGPMTRVLAQTRLTLTEGEQIDMACRAMVRASVDNEGAA